MSEGFAKGAGRAWPVLLLVLAVLLSGSSLAAQNAAEERIEELERAVSALRAEVERLKAESRPAPEAGRAEATPSAEALAELERRIEVLAEEIEKLTLGEAAPAADRSEYGFGPAASKVYRTGEGLSVGGYGELLYEDFASERDDGFASGRTDRAGDRKSVV